jgi:hypothetical protein
VTPASPCASEDLVSVAAPTGVDASVVAGELAAEDPTAMVGPSQVAK